MRHLLRKLIAKQGQKGQKDAEVGNGTTTQ